jgi:fructokinase
MAEPTGMRIGIDIGGTKIAAVILDEQGREQARYRADIPRDYSATIGIISKTVAQLENESRPAAQIGISMPGVVDGAGEPILVANLPWLQGRPFRSDLEDLFERPVHIGNDANCFALSEATDGAAAGAAVVFGVILGTGVGGGLVVNGRLIVGANATAGEWGHNPLPWRMASDGDEITCGCGQIGCIETWLNGAALSRDYLSLAGRQAKPEEISRLAGDGEQHARHAITLYETRLARALAAAINFLDPDVIVLGGGLSAIPSLYTEVSRLWSHYASSGTLATRLVEAKYGPDSGVRGAAWL